jgi:YrbI family 3-deoxy-D-manno-octulosonate 8-phosphate phosphatase
VKVRAAELQIDLVRQGAEDKLTALKEVLAELRLSPVQTCFIGDDLPDLAVVRHVGLGVAVADACAELRQAAAFVTTAPGGRGAAQQRWDDLLHKYES